MPAWKTQPPVNCSQEIQFTVLNCWVTKGAVTEFPRLRLTEELCVTAQGDSPYGDKISVCTWGGGQKDMSFQNRARPHSGNMGKAVLK